MVFVNFYHSLSHNSCLPPFSELLGLFGEGPADRRERLRNVLAHFGEDSVKMRRIGDQVQKKEEVRN